MWGNRNSDQWVGFRTTIRILHKYEQRSSCFTESESHRQLQKCSYLFIMRKLTQFRKGSLWRTWWSPVACCEAHLRVKPWTVCVPCVGWYSVLCVDCGVCCALWVVCYVSVCVHACILCSVYMSTQGWTRAIPAPGSSGIGSCAKFWKLWPTICLTLCIISDALRPKTHMYLHIYTCTHTYTHAHTHIHIHIYTHVCTCTYTYTHAYVYMHTYILMRTHIHVCVYVHMHTCSMNTYVHTYMHIQIHTYIHVQTHAHIHKFCLHVW